MGKDQDECIQLVTDKWSAISKTAPAINQTNNTKNNNKIKPRWIAD